MVRLVDALGLRTVSMCNQPVPRVSPVIDVLTWFDINHSFYAVFRLLCPLDFRTYVAPARRGVFVYRLLIQITSCRSFVLQQEVSFSLLVFRGYCPIITVALFHGAAGVCFVAANAKDSCLMV